MSSIIGLIGIVIALALFMILVYKGWHSYWVAFLCAIIVALTNGLFWGGENGFTAAYQTFVGTYSQGMIDLFGTMLWVVMLGAILAKIFEDSGMAHSIAKLFLRFINRAEGNWKRQVHTAFLWIFIMGGLCSLGGIDPYVLTFIMIPICAEVAKKLDIPRRLIPGMLCLFTCFIVCPGAPNIYNIMGVAGINSITGEIAAASGNFSLIVSSTSGLIAGIVGVLIIAVGAHFIMVRYATKAREAGEHFDWGTMQQTEIEDRPCPNVIVSIIPLVAVFIMYAVFGTHISIALSVGIILAILLGLPYLPMQDRFGNPISRGRSLVKSLNNGALSFPNAFLTVITPAALAAVITSTAAFGMVVGILSDVNMAPVVLCAIATMILVAITSSPPAALMIALPLVVGALLEKTGGTLSGINVHALMRIGVLAAATLETLPFNGMIVLTLNLSHCTHKEGYKPMGMISVVFTFVAMVVGVLLFLAVPSLI